MEATNYIPKEHFNKWYELFKHSKGRLLCNPIDGERVYVRYTFDDMDSYRQLCQSYRRLTTSIVETERGLLKRWRLRFGLAVGG